MESDPIPKDQRNERTTALCAFISSVSVSDSFSTVRGFEVRIITQQRRVLGSSVNDGLGVGLDGVGDENGTARE